MSEKDAIKRLIADAIEGDPGEANEPQEFRTVAFLQNAWSPMYAGAEWPRSSWLKALERSRSGQRLVRLGLSWDCYQNTTAICGETADSVVPPDRDHVARILSEPINLVVACGRQAEQIITEMWAGAMIAIPHPASRTVTDQLYDLTAALIQREFGNRIALRQRRGFIEQETIEL